MSFPSKSHRDRRLSVAGISARGWHDWLAASPSVRELSPAKSLLRLITCLLSVVLLSSFPADSAHDFHQHFRASHVSRSIVTHNFVSVPEDPSADQFTRSALEAIRSLVRAEPQAESQAGFQPPPRVSAAGLFVRFRFGPSRGGGEEPLI
jgi:hypothetical protein